MHLNAQKVAQQTQILMRKCCVEHRDATFHFIVSTSRGDNIIHVYQQVNYRRESDLKKKKEISNLD